MPVQASSMAVLVGALSRQPARSTAGSGKGRSQSALVTRAGLPRNCGPGVAMGPGNKVGNHEGYHIQLEAWLY